jgi:casein kinase II subunit alpha
MKIEWGDLESFEIIEKIGRGKYSDVFLGINVKT